MWRSSRREKALLQGLKEENEQEEQKLQEMLEKIKQRKRMVKHIFFLLVILPID